MSYTSFRKINNTQKTVYTSFFLILAVLLPYVSAHAFGGPGTVFLPMHIPVLLCGLICGVQYGLICGLLAPCLSFLITQMPPAYPMLPIMAVELTLYGAVSGFFSKTLKINLCLSLPAGMLAGRCGYGIMFIILNAFNPALTVPGVWTAIITGLPGIAVQLIFIPAIIEAIFPKKICAKNRLHIF